MDILIDTQILIWSIVSPEKLSTKIKNILENNTICISQISFFEISIKQKIGKMQNLALPINELIKRIIDDNFEILSIKNAHIIAYQDIELHEQHRDPFDRLLLATALSERLPIISADEKFKWYSTQIELIENN